MNRQLSNKEIGTLMFALESAAQDSDDLSLETKESLLNLRDDLEASDVWIAPRDPSITPRT